MFGQRVSFDQNKQVLNNSRWRKRCDLYNHIYAGTEPILLSIMNYSVSQKTSPTFVAVTLESIVGFS